MSPEFRERLLALLLLPRREQAAAARALARSGPGAPEEWNSAFGPGSLFEAWCSTRLVGGIYEANRRELRLREGFRVLEVGGGDGRLWRGMELPAGELVLVDPRPEAHKEVARSLPPQVHLRSLVAPVENALEELPEADLVICSLTLHHVAGRDAAERAEHGMDGPGKREILHVFRHKAPRTLLVEADVFCELELPPGSPILEDRVLDSYVRRCARALMEEGEDPRIEEIIRRWCLGQIEVVDQPPHLRDVYELDQPRWLDLLQKTGFSSVRWAFTDPWGLFIQYVLEA